MRERVADGATSVVAWFYETQKRAFQALLALQRIEQTRGLRSVGVVDATVMSEAADGRVRIDRTVEFREGGEGRLGVVFPPAILAHEAVGRADEDVAEHFSELGFTVNLLREIGENMPHDGAALVLLLREEWFDELKDIVADGADMERWALEVGGPPPC